MKKILKEEKQFAKRKNFQERTMLGSHELSSLNFPPGGKFDTVSLDTTQCVSHPSFPGALVQTTLRCQKSGFRAHVFYSQGAKQPSLSRQSDLEMLVMQGKLSIVNPRTGQKTVLNAGDHFLLPAHCPYQLTCLEDSHVFVISPSVMMGSVEVEARDVEIE